MSNCSFIKLGETCAKLSQVALVIGSGNSSSQGLFDCAPVPMPTCWYNISSCVPPFFIDEMDEAAAAMDPALYVGPVIGATTPVVVAICSTTPSCSAFSYPL